MPCMQESQQLNNFVNWYKQNRSRQQGDRSRRWGQPPKRKRTDTSRHEQDMEMDDEAVNLPPEIGQPQTKLNGDHPRKRRKYDDDSSDKGGYSPVHPGVECGKAEMELLKRYRRRSREGNQQPPLPRGSVETGHQQPPLPQEPTETGSQEKMSAVSSTTKRRRSREEGELVSDEEENEEEEEEDEEAPPQRTLGFWLKEPLAQLLERDPKPRPPPRPPVVLPMDALTRFYTSCTVLQQHGLKDRFLWLDPVYGNVQVPSGRYERVKKILSKRSYRR